MKEYTEEQQLLRRSMLRVLALSFIYALAGNAFLYTAYFIRGIMEWSYLISGLLVIAFAVPVTLLFRNRHWYFPAFIFLFWIPFGVLLAYMLSLVLPLGDERYDFGLLLVYFLILNVIVMVLGLVLGMLVNGLLTLWRRIQS